MVRALFLVFALATGVEEGDRWDVVYTTPRATPPAATADWQERIDERPELELWMRSTLPSSAPRDAHVIFRSYVSALDVWIGSRKIYTFDEPAARGHLRLHDVPLPPDAAGQSVFVRVPPGARAPIFAGRPLLASARSVPRALFLTVRGPLREDADALVAGMLLVLIGALSFAVSRVRRRGNAAALLWFGVFTFLYGARILLGSFIPIILGFSVRTLDFAEAAITYTITIPGWLLARELIGNGWRNTLRWQVVAFAVFTPLGLVSDALTGVPESLRFGNNVLVILGGANIVLNLVLLRRGQTRELRVVTLGAGAFLLFALVNNLSALGFLPWRDIDETYGFLLFVAALGYAATRSFLRGERARLAIEGELATAREIQRSILPAEMPSIAGLRFSARYVPATSVAGDVYDFVATDAHRTGVLVADVAGHGVPAALVASMVKVVVSSQQSLASDPAAMLRQLNVVLKREVRRTLVTATFLHIDGAARSVRVANAGHAPPLLLRRGTFRELGRHGILLGRFGEVTYTAEEIALEKGDRIAAWTDGIVEARNARGEEFGEERLQELLRTRDAAADAIVDAVLAWRDRDSDADDLTIVVIDVT